MRAIIALGAGAVLLIAIAGFSLAYWFLVQIQ